VVSFAGTNLTYKDVINNLSILDYDYYFEITNEVREGNIPGALLTYNELISDGFDGHHFITGLAGHFRDLLVSKTESTLSLLEVSKGTRERYKLQASQIVQKHILQYLAICSKCDIEYRTAKNQRLHVELALIRLCLVAGGQEEEMPLTTFEKKTEVRKIVAKKAEVSDSYGSSNSTPSKPLEQAVNKIKEESSEQPMVNESSAEELAKPIAPFAKAQISSQEVTKDAAPAPSLFKNTSLASLKKKVEEVVNEEQKENFPDLKNSFDHETLIKFWSLFSDKAKSEGKIQLSTTLTMYVPVIKENYQIEISVHNPTQLELLVEEKEDLVNYLREKLSNYALNVHAVIDENREQGEEIFTNKEKYKKMAEKNPGLDDFRKQLGLELEL